MRKFGTDGCLFHAEELTVPWLARRRCSELELQGAGLVRRGGKYGGAHRDSDAGCLGVDYCTER